MPDMNTDGNGYTRIGVGPPEPWPVVTLPPASWGRVIAWDALDESERAWLAASRKAARRRTQRALALGAGLLAAAALIWWRSRG